MLDVCADVEGSLRRLHWRNIRLSNLITLFLFHNYETYNDLAIKMRRLYLDAFWLIEL